METATMGRVTVPVKLENVVELHNAQTGIIPEDQVHRLEIPDALVDTGATYLAMPRSLLVQLGFDKPFTTARMRTTRDEAAANIYGPVRLTVQGRSCTVDVAEIAEGRPVLLGQVPLELLDFVIDPKQQRLIGNPEHGGEFMIEMY